MSNLSNKTFTFSCSDIYGIKEQAGPIFETCTQRPQGGTNLCIGSRDQQHACATGDCNVVDWLSSIASPCEPHLIEYARVQSAGPMFPCCTDNACTDSSGSSVEQYTTAKILCASDAASLWMCVSDGVSAECVNPDPRNNVICSGKFASFLANSTSGSAKPSGSSTHAKGGIETNDLIAIVTSILGGVVSIGTILGVLWRLKQKRKNKKIGDKLESDSDTSLLESQTNGQPGAETRISSSDTQNPDRPAA